MKLTSLILAAASIATLAAQDASSVRVGFPFEVDGKPQSAGVYELNRQAGRSFLQVRDRATGKSFFVSAAGTTAGEVRPAALVFSVAGNLYMLRSIKTATANLSVQQSRRALEMAKNAPTVIVTAD